MNDLFINYKINSLKKEDQVYEIVTSLKDELYFGHVVESWESADIFYSHIKNELIINRGGVYKWSRQLE